jgi:choline kinase
MKAVILAAGMGSRLAPHTNDRPKPLVPVGGRPLLIRTLDRLAEVGITGGDVIVVGGYREDVLRATLAREGRRVTVVNNPLYDSWNNWYSLYVAREAIGNDGLLQIDGDVLLDGQVLPRMLEAPGSALLAVDVRPELDAETMKVEADGPDRKIRAISKKLDPRTAIGEYIGVTRLDATVAAQVFDDMTRFEAEKLTHEYYEHAYHRLAQSGAASFRAVDVGDCTTIEIDDANDLARAEALLERQRSVA